jgi:tRNA pseudouridine32 synthase/23S rRNA pseudouridine746 synthase
MPEPNAETHIALIGRLAAPQPRLALQALAHPRWANQQVAHQHFAHYRLTPRTGRKHQLRAQLSALGLPIVGDRIYPTLLPQPAADAQPDYSQPLQLLAREFSFVDPISGRPHRFVSRRQLQWVAAGAAVA